MEALSLDAKKRLFMYEDAKAFLGAVKENRPDIKVYTATTNPRLIIFAKLSTGGFADKNGSPCLDGAFGGEEVYPGGKASPEFYTALLDRTGSDVDSSLMVGDSPEMDLKLAKAAGINQVVLPRRNQQEEYVVEADGGMYIKRLDYILELIK
jgi:FMN phosphatase YigB (HAD superfamily)